MLFKKSITVKEVNYYLSPVVKELLSKHKKYSNPDFEKELIELTGIGWKQVKNYKNHPSPNKKIHSNSKIQKFIFRERNKDKFIKFKKLSLYFATTLFCALFILGFVNWRNGGDSRRGIFEKINGEVSTLLEKNRLLIESSMLKEPLVIGYNENIISLSETFNCKKSGSGTYYCWQKNKSLGFGIELFISNNFIKHLSIRGKIDSYLGDLRRSFERCQVIQGANTEICSKKNFLMEIKKEGDLYLVNIFMD